MFFQAIKDNLKNQDLNITISFNNGIMTVSVLPKIKTEVNNENESLTPLLLSGTPEEMDEQFLKYVSITSQKTNEFATNIKTFKTQIEVMEESAKKKVDEKIKKPNSKAKAAPAALFDANDTKEEEEEEEVE